jgi:TRAP-type C4-dicarboxylate transport system permease small subunit
MHGVLGGVRVAHLLCVVFLFVFLRYVLCSMLSVSLDFPLLIPDCDNNRIMFVAMTSI